MAVVWVEPVREDPGFQMQPDALDGVEFGRIRRQRYERHVGRHDKPARAMPSGLVEHHDGVIVRSKCRREAVQKLLHRVCVGVGQHQGEGIVAARLHGREDVGEGEALVAKPWRALAPLPPNVAGAPILADARFILEEQADALVFMRILNVSEQCRGSF